MALLMGMRASEIVERTIRNLDDDGRLLWITDAKTQAGIRRLQVPPQLQGHLQRLGAAGDPGIGSSVLPPAGTDSSLRSAVVQKPPASRQCRPTASRAHTRRWR